VIEYMPGVAPRMRAGDAVVHRGTVHNWVDCGDQPCVIAFVLIDAKPVMAGGRTLPAVGELPSFSA
jgi:hypothetical protein